MSAASTAWIRIEPLSGTPSDAPAREAERRSGPSSSSTYPCRSIFLSPCLYLPHHRWFLALAALDLILTTTILNLGGTEANLIPRAILAHAGLAGMVALKAASVIAVLILAEHVGRRREPAGRVIALSAVAANTAAATLGAACIAVYHAAAYV